MGAVAINTLKAGETLPRHRRERRVAAAMAHRRGRAGAKQTAAACPSTFPDRKATVAEVREYLATGQLPERIKR